MELNFSTFVLELVNFLVLVWILKRFLYRPVLDIIAKRRDEIDKTMSEAKRIESDAQALQARYEGRLADWEHEQAEAHESLARELEKERSSRMAALRESLEEERKKIRAAESQRMEDLRGRDERSALALGARFATRLLEQAATAELQTKLLEKLLKDLDSTPPERIERLLGNPDLPPDSIRISSAFPLTKAQADMLGKRLGKLTKLDAPVSFEEDPALLAGIRLTIGACVLGLNLEDELEGFARLGDGDE